MPFTRKMPVWILSGLLLCSEASGAGRTASGNPYHQIFERNVFGLKPPAPAQVQQPLVPLPKITLTGITTIFGRKRALLRVQLPAQPRQPAREQSYVLSEGQREGSIQVLDINEKTDKVKVENSGTLMEITFEKPSPPPQAAAPAPRMQWPALPVPPRFVRGARLN